MDKKMFSTEFLNNHLSDFRLRSITDIDHKITVLDKWALAVDSSKLKLQKEEEVKSAFIQDIFCDVLGFDSKNPTHWQVREEFKVIIGATKPDAALGSFKIKNNLIHNEVHVVVEIKDAKTDLDKKQNRKDFTGTPVDQAFRYASKMGGNCNWVVVSNLEEIRFYHYRSQNSYQSYLLSKLYEEETLKEFLFLFHKDRLTNTINSSTDKLYELSLKFKKQPAISAHIIDKIHYAMQRFSGLGFLDPEFIANMKPFNLETYHVWHFNKGRLLILNPEIARLFDELTTDQEGLTLSNKLIGEIKKAKVLEAKEKLAFIFRFFYSCLITDVCTPKDLKSLREKTNKGSGFSLRHFNNIKDEELHILSTKIQIPDQCDCINCAYRSFNFKALIKRSNETHQKKSSDHLEEGYLDYLLGTDNYKKAYFTYKKAEIQTKSHENGSIKYFISKINQMHLHNLVEGFGDSHKNREILDDIRNIDLDHSIHNELDMYVDADVRRYLIEIKEEKLFTRIRKKVAEIISRVNEGKEWGGDLTSLTQSYNMLYSHFHKNYLVFDAFTDFKTTASDIITVLINKFKKKEIEHLNEFYLTEAILYIYPSTLKMVLMDCPDILILDKDKAGLLEKAVNFLQSFYREGYAILKEELLIPQLLNHNFQRKVTNIFHNMFIIFNRISFEHSEVEILANPLSNLMESQDFLSWEDLQALGLFLERYGFILKEYQLEAMLKKAAEGDDYGTHRYHNLINSICLTLQRHYPDYKIHDQSLIRRAIANNTDHNGRLHINHLIPLSTVIDQDNKTYLVKQFIQDLNREFDAHQYTEIVFGEIIPWDYQDYFMKYAVQVNKNKRTSFTKFLKNGEPDFTDLAMINFILHIHNYKINKKRPELALMENLSDFEQWALYPLNFDYNKFDVRWLLAFKGHLAIDQFKANTKILTALHLFLQQQYHESLSKIYFVLSS